MGGGQYGHLGLVLDDVTYHTLTGENYTRPVHPGALVIVAGTAHHEAVRLRDDHTEQIRIYRETIDVERALMKQIINTVEIDYIKELFNEITGTITVTIPEVLTFLFTRYGEVDIQRVTKEEDKVKNYAWNITDPPVVLFNLIEDLDTISTAANVTKTVNQRINYGLEIIRTTGEFETALTTWFARPPIEHTWANFKLHFTDAHTSLSRVRGSSMRGSAFHQANTTVAALSYEMANIRNDLVDSINALSNQVTENLYTTEDPPPAIAPTTVQDPQMLAVASNQTALVTAIQDLQEQIRILSQSNNMPRNNVVPRIYRNTNNSSRDNTNRRRRNISKYCWTHGACAHDSFTCESTTEGHKRQATFSNKMGGSQAYCSPSNA